jgi:hypothetical protein
MSSGKFIQRNSYTIKVSGIVSVEKIILPRTGVSFLWALAVGFKTWSMLYQCSADKISQKHFVQVRGVVAQRPALR